MRRLLLATIAALALLAAPAFAQEVKPTVSDISDEVMCVVCGVPLNIAEAPQADRERAFIQDLIDQGLTKEEIKDELVDEYGEQVLADPRGGMGTAAWLIPLVLLAAALGALAWFVPRWRRRTQARVAAEAESAAAEPAPTPLPDDDQRRLDEDLARYR